MSYDYFKFLTSKVEVEVKAEAVVKMEVSLGLEICISTSIQDFKALA